MQQVLIKLKRLVEYVIVITIWRKLLQTFLREREREREREWVSEREREGREREKEKEERD